MKIRKLQNIPFHSFSSFIPHLEPGIENQVKVQRSWPELDVPPRSRKWELPAVQTKPVLANFKNRTCQYGQLDG